MKKIALILLVLVLGSSSVLANNNSEANPEQKLRNEIATLLEKPEFSLEKEALHANIEFTVNSNGEIVVLTVNAEEAIVAEYVKSRLNYQKIDTGVSNKRNKVFKLSLKIKKSKDA